MYPGMSLGLKGKNLSISLCLQMLNWGPHLTKKSRVPLPSRKDRTQSSPLGCTSQVSYVESKADVRNGLAEPRAGFWQYCLPRAGGEEELCTAESAPLPVGCFCTASSPWKHSDRLTTQKKVFPFLLYWIISCYSQQLKVLF